MKKIKLTKGFVALVDDEDFEYLNQWKWLMGDMYAARTIMKVKADGSKLKTTQLMHKLLIDVPNGMYVDHINQNKLDNRKSNLRVCTFSENQRNRGKQLNNKTGYKGVSYKTKNKKFVAQIKVEKKQIHIGLFNCPVEAAKAYNQAAIKLHGKFAQLNQIP